MTDDAKHEVTADDLFFDDELSDESLDRAAAQGGKASQCTGCTACL